MYQCTLFNDFLRTDQNQLSYLARIAEYLGLGCKYIWFRKFKLVAVSNVY